MAPTVTVIVPTWDRLDLIGLSIESALRQTYEDFVLIVGDNGGNPGTEDVVRAYDDPRIRYVRHPENLGGQGNWLELIRLAETPLVASLHDDDIWEPTFLEKCVPPMLDDPTLGMCFCDHWCINANGERLVEHTDWLSAHSGRDVLPAGRFEGSRDDALRMVVVRNAPQPAYASVLRRASVLDTTFPPEITPIYDLWLSYRMWSRGEGFFYVPERLTQYRVWSGSVTARGYADGLDGVFAHIVAENIGGGPVLDEIQQEWATRRFDRARDALGDRADRDASRRDFRLASPSLSGPRWLVAEVAGRSTLGWEATRAARAGLRAVRARLRPDRRTTSGLSEHDTRPSERARQLTD